MKTLIAAFCILALLIEMQFCSAFRSRGVSCGKKYRHVPDTLTSPGYPNAYPSGSDCEWIISTSQNQIINLKFTVFMLESHKDCRYDYVMVYDGASKNPSKLLGRFCGKKLPPTLVSSGSKMLIVFHSDGSVVLQGFFARFTTSYGCDRDLTKDSGEITSPNFPKEYPQPFQCNYRIKVKAGYKIQLQFHEFKLENASANGCEYDYVMVRDGPDEGNRLMGKFCGLTKPSVRASTRHEMLVKFIADPTVSKTGFRITYEAKAIGDDREFTEDSGEITSPNFPNPYPQPTHYTYRINVTSGYTIRLEFEQFKLEAGHGCRYDYVEVYDGPTDSSPKLGKFCGSTKPSVRASTGNQMLIRFVADGSIHYQGFRIKYHAN